MTKEKIAPAHNDLFGQPIAVGDCVVYPRSNLMMVGTVIKLNPKMVGVRAVGSRSWGSANKYPQELVKVNGAEVTMYLLKNNKNS